MFEKQYLFRRKLQVTALALGILAWLTCYLNKGHAHVDLVHIEVDSIVREIIDDMRENMDKASRECAFGCSGERDYDYKGCEKDNEPGVKHD